MIRMVNLGFFQAFFFFFCVSSIPPSIVLYIFLQKKKIGWSSIEKTKWEWTCAISNTDMCLCNKSLYILSYSVHPAIIPVFQRQNSAKKKTPRLGFHKGFSWLLSIYIIENSARINRVVKKKRKSLYQGLLQQNKFSRVFKRVTFFLPLYCRCALAWLSLHKIMKYIKGLYWKE